MEVKMVDPIELVLGDSMCSWKRVNDLGSTQELFKGLLGVFITFIYQIRHVNFLKTLNI